MTFRRSRLGPFAKLTVFAACALAGTACGHPVQKKLEGRWLGDSVENFDDGHVAAATGWAKGTSLEFAGSTMTVAIPAEEPRSGKYKVARVHDADVELAVVREDGRTDKARFKLDDEHSIRWMLGDGRAVVLRRDP
ncbi:MAG TPA: hypothetical protein VK524_05035 [Polyangiaceae bacterium]|nr:hypothetical protein [Polyangiaceae bacterium]